MNGRKTGRTAIIIPALYALGGLFSCLFAGDTGTTGGVSAGGLISGDNRMAGSLQGIGGPFSKWGGESIGNSGGGFVYAASGRTGATDKRPEFTRKSPDPDKPPIADKVSFSQSQPETKVSIDDIRSISFGMETADAAPGSGFSVKSAKADVAVNKVSDFRPGWNDEIKYPEVEDGVDLYYQARGNRLEEDIVLKKPPQKNTFNFKLNMRGLTAIPQADGTIHFRDDQSGQLMFYFDKPFMIDSAGSRSEGVHLKLLSPGKLVVEADSGWLYKEARQYPVVIDPTLVFVSTFSGWGGAEPLLRTVKDNSGGLYILSNSSASVAGLGYNYSTSAGEIWSLTEITTTTASCPRCAIAVDSAKKTHIVFGTYYNPYSIAYINNVTGTWAAPELISANTTFFQPVSHDWGDYGITLLSDSANNLHLIWPSGNNGGTIYYSKKPSGGNWTAPQTLNNPAAQPLHGAAMTVDGNDKLHLIGWYDYTNGYAVYMNTLSGTWSTPEIIYSSYCGWGSIAIDNNNKPHVALYASWWKTAYLNKVQATWSNPLLLKCMSHAIIGTDKHNNSHIVCEPGGGLASVPNPRQLYQTNNVNGVWSPSVPTPFNEVMGSMDAVLDKNLTIWHMALLHGRGQGGFASEGPVSYYRLDDLTPPALIRDLKAGPGISSGTIVLNWTAPGGDGMSGAASRYDVKVATWPVINQDDYDSLPVYSTWTAPRPAYSPESHVVSGLAGGVTYYIAVLSFDAQNNASYVTSAANIVAGTVTPIALSGWSVSAAAASADTAILPPADLKGGVLPDLKVKLEWSPSPSTKTVAAYSVYWDSGAGVMDYITPLASVVPPATSYTTVSLSTGVYRFGIRSAAGNGIEEPNTSVVVSVKVDTVVVNVPVRAEIKVPQSGKRIAGNRVTVLAELGTGSPSVVRQVLFQYRAAGSSSTVWNDIPAAGYNQSNPAASQPYFIHWDVSGLSNWDYELRAVAANIYGQADPAPPSIFVSIDAANPQIEEKAVGSSQQKRTEVYNTVSNKVELGAENGTLISVTLSAGVVTAAATTLKTVSNPPSVPAAGSALLPAGQNLGLTLENGQTMLNSPATLSLQYQDGDNDGLVDGTLARADKLAIYAYDPASGQWRKESASSIDQIGKTVTAQTAHFSLFGLFAPAAADLSDVLVYPVPWVPNDGNPDNGKPYNSADPASGIVFDNLTQSARIQIYTITGELVWEKTTDTSSGKLQWDGKNNSGRNAASGGYFAVITDTADGSKITRKIAVVR